MKNKLNPIIFIDDDSICNFLHTQIIKITKLNLEVQTYTEANKALMVLTDHLQSAGLERSSIIFVDINMPVMDGWGFLDRFTELSARYDHNCKVFMLSSSNNSADIQKAQTYPILNGFVSKPLTVRHIKQIVEEQQGTETFYIPTERLLNQNC